jgi:hypothetical protein
LPKFYFHYRTDDALLEDHEGSVHPDLDAAEAHAAELGRSLLRVALRKGQDPRAPRSIEITDESGADQLYVVFWASMVPNDPGKRQDTLAAPTLH